MLRLALLLLSVSGVSAVYAAPPAAAVAPVTPAATSACEAKPAQSAAEATAESSASDAPAQRSDAAGPRAGVGSGTRVRAASTRWHRLLPGMFR